MGKKDAIAIFAASQDQLAILVPPAKTEKDFPCRKVEELTQAFEIDGLEVNDAISPTSATASTIGLALESESSSDPVHNLRLLLVITLSYGYNFIIRDLCVKHHAFQSSGFCSSHILP